MGFKKFIKKAVGSVAGGIIGGPVGAAFGALSGGDKQAIAGLGNAGNIAAGQKVLRETDFKEGLKFGKEQIGEGSLGRLGGDPDIEAALQIRRQALGGLTGAEQQAQRDVATQRIQAQTQGARRQLAASQARSGVRGATAGAQQSEILGQGIDATRQFEQNLFLQNRQAQQSAAGQLLGDVTDVRQFDLGQAAREKLAQLQTGLGFQQLGVTERAGVTAANASVAAANAQSPSGGLLGGVLGK